MDFAQVLMELWRRRVWLLVGLVVATVVAVSTVYRVSLFPPDLESRQLELGVADTQLLVDAPNSAITDLGIGFKQLSERAGVYTRLMTTRPVRRAIARRMDVPEEAIVTVAPLPNSVPRAGREPDRPTRANEILDEIGRLVLTFTSVPTAPTITIQAEAPTGETAVRLADAAAEGFTAYVEKRERVEGVPPSRRVALRQLGSAQGGTIAEGVDLKLAALAFAGTFLVWCLLVLLVSNVAASMRTLRAAERPDAAAGEPAA